MALAADWPMWGGSPGRNAVSAATGIPYQWDVATKQNIKWLAPLGTQTYGGPVIAGGKVYVGTNNAGNFRPGIKGDKGCVLCLDEKTGKLLWQATHDKLASGAQNDWPEQGVASTPLVEGDRVYYVSNRCELVCADANGFLDGKNDGPFKDEKYTEPQDADFIWVLDMISQLGVYPHNLAACSPVSGGDLIFVCTGNGVDEDHETPPAPDAPSFIALNKQSGQVVWKRNDPGRNILHGQWASPAYGVIADKPQVVFPGGDGWCYAFEAATGEPLWKFDLNPKDSAWEIGGSGSKTSIVATPVISGNTVYLAAGDDPESSKGPGHLYAIDATKTGDITASGRLWHVGGKDFGRTIAGVAVADGLLYAVDLDGFLSCFDAQTGQRYWRYDMQAGVWGSPLVVDGKVMLGNTDGEVAVLQDGKELKELARNDMRSGVYGSAAVANGTLYVATQKALYAIAGDAAEHSAESAPATRPTTTRAATQPVSPSATSQAIPGSDWPMFRGNPHLTGVAGSSLPDKLRVRWKHEIGEGTSSTAAIADGIVYVGADDKKLRALDMASGKLKWEYTAEDSIMSSPTVAGGLVIFGDETGTLHACDIQTGRQRWTFKTGDRIISSVNFKGDRLVFGSYDGHLYCLQVADGQPVWKYDVGERVHGTAGIVDDVVLTAACDAQLHVVKLADGTLVRKVTLDSVSGSAAAARGSRVFLGTYGQQVLGIDWQAGSVVWRFEDKERGFPFLSSAALADKLVVIGGQDKRLHALDPATGEQRWQFVTKGRIDSCPVIVGQRVFVGSADGCLYGIELSSGKELWRFEAGGPISASPAVGEGCLVIGTEDGVVYCLGAPP